MLKTEAEGRGFQHLPRDPANVNTLKNHHALYLCTVLEIRSSHGLAAVDECRNWTFFVYRDIKKCLYS